MQKLLEIKRGNIVEREHYGEILIFSPTDGVRYVTPQTTNLYYLRSCAKPMQVSVCDSLGGFEKFFFSDKEIAVMCSSHSGTQEHVDAIKGILSKIGLDESYLKCGTHAPLDVESSFFLKKNGKNPCELHNNCSGKHAGFLSACVFMGWDIDSYLESSHPLQKMILARIEDYCNFKIDECSVDGCGAPIWGMPIHNMAEGFGKCFAKHPRIVKAICCEPYLAGGHSRIDSEITAASCGTLIAKVGAEGLLAVYNLKTSEVFIVKITDSNEQARAIVAIDMLLKLNWLIKKQVESSFLQNFFDLTVKNHAGKIVGEILPLAKL